MGQTFSTNGNESPRPVDNSESNGRNRRSASTSPPPVRGIHPLRFDPLSRTYRARSTPLSTPSESVGPDETRQQTPTRMVTRSMARRSRSRAMPATIPPFRSNLGSTRLDSLSPSSHRREQNVSSSSILAPSLIADVITEAVLSAFRERHGNMESAANAVAHAAAAAAVTVAANAAAAANNNNNNITTSTPSNTSVTDTAETPSIYNQQQRAMPIQEEPMQASVHIPPTGLPLTPSTGESSEESFFRYVRLPVLFSAMPDSEQRREVAMPMFIVGYRVRAAAEDLQTAGQQNQNVSVESENLRRSPRIAERDDRRQQQQEQLRRTDGEEQHHNHNVASRWVVYILSSAGNGNLSGLSDSPTYEELLALAESIGYARSPISIDQINASAPIQLYTAQVGGAMLGNTEQCLVCLEGFQEMESVRVLKCHHGFHQNCIDKWLTEGQNRCPLCRVAPVERVSQVAGAAESTE